VPPANESPANEAPVPAQAPSTPAQSLEECEQRLEQARERLKAHGYQPKYTDEEILAQAQTGELDDRFVVRFMETKHAGPDGMLGRADEAGNVKYWSTTFNQLENADTDPETICALIGKPDYDPKAEYTLAIVDIQAYGASQATTIVPTYEKLGEFACAEVKGLDPEVVKEVMTPEYSAVYHKEMDEFNDWGLNIHNPDDVLRYSDRRFESIEERDRFATRAKLQQELGANEEYTGNGTTKNLLYGDQGSRPGVMETFTYDKNPKTLGHLTEKNSCTLIATKPF
jgi:hypothetical protein